MMIRYSGPLQHDGVSFRCLSSKGRHFDYVVEYNILYWYHIGSEKRVLIFFLVGLYLCVTHTHTHTHTHTFTIPYCHGLCLVPSFLLLLVVVVVVVVVPCIHAGCIIFQVPWGVIRDDNTVRNAHKGNG